MKNYIKLNKEMKTVKTVKSVTKEVKKVQRSRYVKIAKGVYQYVPAPTKAGKKVATKTTYRVMKMVDGKKFNAYFTSKTKAIQFYKGL